VAIGRARVLVHAVLVGSWRSERLRATECGWRSLAWNRRAYAQGWHPGIEAYSAFEGYITAPTDPEDEPPQNTPPALAPPDTALAKLFREKGVEQVVVTGLATDYWCVGPIVQ
jgi:nicotinamidase-related amidase